MLSWKYAMIPPEVFALKLSCTVDITGAVVGQSSNVRGGGAQGCIVGRLWQRLRSPALDLLLFCAQWCGCLSSKSCPSLLEGLLWSCKSCTCDLVCCIQTLYINSVNHFVFSQTLMREFSEGLCWQCSVCKCGQMQVNRQTLSVIPGHEHEVMCDFPLWARPLLYRCAEQIADSDSLFFSFYRLCNMKYLTS